MFNYNSLPREQDPLCDWVISYVGLSLCWICISKKSLGFNFQGNDGCLLQCKSFIVFGIWVHVPMNW